MTDANITPQHSKTVSSLDSLPSDENSEIFAQPDKGYNGDGLLREEVPIELTSVTDEAISRSLSQIQSRRSNLTFKDYEADRNNPVDSKSILNKNDSVTKEQFDRFNKGTKFVCIAVAAASGFISPLSSLAFLPAIPEIASRFNTSAEVINISSAVYCIFMSLSPCVFSPCSDIYGRRPTFLVCCLCCAVSNLLVGFSENLVMFFIFRSTTAFFGTSFFSIGAHIAGDIYHPTQRGRAMSMIISGSQLGSSFGPVLGGILVTYTSWRAIFWVLAGITFAVGLPAIFFLPETSIETKHSIVLHEARKTNPNKKFVFILFNPLKIMSALKYPNLFMDGFISIACIFNMYNLLTPIRYVLDPRFNLTKPIYSGLFYLAPGLGYLVGSFIGGSWADYTVKKYIKKRGRRVPEDRLRTILIPIGLVFPISIIIYGWSVEKKKGGMAVPIIFMFLSGLAQTCIFPASNTYCVDSMPEIGGDGIGSSYFTRYVAAAISSATCLKSVNNIGLGWTCVIGAFVLWIGFGLTLILIYFGEKIRINSLVKHGLRDK